MDDVMALFSGLSASGRSCKGHAAALQPPRVVLVGVVDVMMVLVFAGANPTTTCERKCDMIGHMVCVCMCIHLHCIVSYQTVRRYVWHGDHNLHASVSTPVMKD